MLRPVIRSAGEPVPRYDPHLRSRTHPCREIRGTEPDASQRAATGPCALRRHVVPDTANSKGHDGVRVLFASTLGLHYHGGRMAPSAGAGSILADRAASPGS